MALYPEHFIQQVAQSTDIVELIGQYLELKRKGREYVGLCPFHDDRTPSLNVSPTKQIFKCFSCGAGGGVYQFLMRYETMPFPEAVRSLAERAHIPLPADMDTAPAHPRGAGKNDLLAVCARAEKFFREQLQSPAGKKALDYAHSRGLTDESIERFGLGYAPDSWDALIRAAGRGRVSARQLVAAGLAIERERGDGCYDRFRHRLMFPILDATGKPIAFGGRALKADDPAKYLNSSESILFDKSSCLYGLSWARPAMRTTGRAVIVEGYLDVLIPVQAGVENVVATMGTALTDRHVRQLRHHAQEAVLIFDADQAGAAAAERALEIFLAQQLHVRVATIPAGKDPCDYCLAEGPEALADLIDQAPDALQYVWDRRQAEYRDAAGKPAQQRRITEEFLRLISGTAAYGAIDDVRRGQLAQHIAHMLNLPLADLQQQMRRLTRRTRRPAGQPAAAPAAEAAARAERHLLEVLVNEGSLFDHVCEKVHPDDFTNPHLRAVAAAVWRLGHDGRLDLEDLLAAADMAELGDLIADLATTGEQRGNYEQTLTGAMELMLYRHEKQEVREIRTGEMDDEALRQFQQRLASGNAGPGLGRGSKRRRPKVQ